MGDEAQLFIALPRRRQDGARYVANMLPLTSGARGTWPVLPTPRSRAVFIRKVALETSSPPEVIARTYKLTPTELRVLLAIVEVGGVLEVATALGVAETTVKTHLSRLFVKTGAVRQTGPVKILAGYASPLIGKGRTREARLISELARCSRCPDSYQVLQRNEMARCAYRQSYAHVPGTC